MTTHFADGLESGDTTLWTLETADNGGSLTVQGVTVRVGAYALKSSSDGSSASVHAYVEKSVPDLYEVFWRFYIRFSALPAVGERIGVASLFNNVNRGIVNLNVRNDAGTMKWTNYWYNGAWNAESAASGPAIGVWYCVELRAKIAAVGGEVYVWVNEEEVQSATGIADLNVHGPCDRVSVGIDLMSVALAADLYYDECRCGDQRVTCRLGDVDQQRTFGLTI